MKNIYLIKDLARLSGHSIYTVKYYLKIGLLKEIGRSPETNFRYFDDATLSALQHIRQMRLKGKSLSQIGKQLLIHKTK
ncbi:MAG: MerR family transcriptional regulator [Candidatus Omnitrophica bacterium]|nr:MerR family transcriptional regulator [Candidatus Omnitrophota bacterium]